MGLVILKLVSKTDLGSGYWAVLAITTKLPHVKNAKSKACKVIKYEKTLRSSLLAHFA